MVGVTHEILDLGPSSGVVTDALLGTNFLFHQDDVAEGSDFATVVEDIGIQTIRYPGGTIAEEYFDLSDPNAEVQSNAIDIAHGASTVRERSVTPLDDFIAYCNDTGAAMSIVLPTYRYFDLHTGAMRAGAEAEVKDFIRDLLAGVYGPVDAITLELGNEHYQGRFNWTTDEFGYAQAQIATWVDEAAREEGRREDVTVLAQAGRSTAENETLASHFEDGLEESIDGVLTHLYGVNSQGNAMGIGGGIGRRLRDINDVWGDTLGDDFHLGVTEWNVGEDGPDNTAISGMMRIAPLLRILGEMVEESVDTAMIWSTVTNGPAGLSQVVEGELRLSATGYLYEMLTAHIVGKQLMAAENSNKIFDETGAEVGYAYVYSDESHVVTYLANGSDSDLDLAIDVSSQYQSDAYVYYTVLASLDPNATTDYWTEAAIWHVTDVDLSGGSLDEWVFVEELAAYALIELHVVTGRGVDIHGDRQNAIADHLIGSDYDDTLFGHLGDDHLSGGAGADRLEGGAGADLLEGGLEDDALFGGDGNDEIFGGDGADWIEGGAGDDLLIGGALNDTLFAGSGIDTLDGGAGDDAVHADDAAGLASGGAGTDTLSFAQASAGVAVWIPHGVAETEAGLVEHTEFEIFVGSPHEDRFFLATDGVQLDAGDGDDHIDLIDGGANSLGLGAGDDTVFVYSTGTNTIAGGAGDDTFMLFSGQTRVEGGAGDDVIYAFSLGEDRFVFGAEAGQDEIHGFRTGEDYVEVMGWTESDLDLSQIAEGTLLGSPDGSSLLLVDVFDFAPQSDLAFL